MMKIRVDQLGETPKAFSFAPDPADWEALADALPAREGGPQAPLSFAVRVYRAVEDLIVEGELTAELDLGCARCLARYRQALRETFRVVLESAATRRPAEPEAARALAENGMCLGDELDSGWFQGAEIDLSAYFLEVVALANPVQPICRPECRGLCPRCGIDLNQGSCNCADTRPESPFAALAVLQKGNGRGD